MDLVLAAEIQIGELAAPAPPCQFHPLPPKNTLHFRKKTILPSDETVAKGGKVPKTLTEEPTD